MEKSKSGAGRKPAWAKRIGILFGALVLLLIVGFFVVTSSAFLKAMVLPRASAALNAKITAEQIALSPFSQIEIRGLRVETTGSEPIVTVQQARVRYALMDIIKGNINVDEISLQSPVINIIQETDGTSNLDPLLKGGEKPAADSGKKGQTKLSVRNVALKNATIRQVQKLKGGGAKTTEIQNLEVALDRLGNGQSGKLALNAALSMELKSGATNDALKGTISGGYDISLNNELLPQIVTGSTKLSVASAQGAFADLAGFNGSLDADLTPKELRNVALAFSKNNQRLGEVRASGPLDLERREGNLRVEILSLNKNALALAMAGRPVDFHQSEINSTNQIAISQGGTFFAASGNLAGTKISVTQGAATTPEMNVAIEYQASINTADSSAVLQKFAVTGSQDGREFLRTTLDRQMNLSWGETVKGYKDAALNVAVTNFNLADWRALLGTNISTGVLQANLALVAQQDGKILKTDLAARIAGLTATVGSNRVQNADLQLELAGTVEQLKVINVSQYSVALSQGGAETLQANGAARHDLETKETRAQVTARGDLARLLVLAPVTNLTARTGRVEITANYSESSGNRKALGSATLSDFTGRFEPYEFQKYQVNFEYNLEMDPRKVDIHRVAATFSQGFDSGGSIDAKGRYDLEQKSGQFTFRTVDLNQHAVRPLLAPSLGSNQLVSMAINAAGEAALDPKGENSVKASVKVANWVVKDPAGTLPQTPLAAEVNLDAGQRGEAIDLRDLGLKLSPTQRAKNELHVQGKVDLAQTNPAPSSVAIRSESLDLTPYYDMFAGGTNQAAAQPAQAPAPVQSEPEREPAPMVLPFRQLAVDLKIDRLYLRELAISNWTAQLLMRTNTVELKPFKLEINGGALGLTAMVNTALPGYSYDVGLQAGGIPLEPVVNTFSPGYSNKLAGNFIADARITGAGVTGPSLRKNLGGQIMLNLTNLNYEVVGPKLRRILVPISIALRVPELTGTPLNWVSLQTAISKGVVNIAKLGVQSEAFYAESAGPITLDDVLTNSVLNLPLDISLRRSLAHKSGLLPENTPPDAKYAPLPRFVTVKGTLGAPDPDISELVVAGMIAKGAVGIGKLGGEKAGQALGTIGNFLTGQTSTNNNSTNAASTNASPAQNLLRGLGGLLGGEPAASNAPAGKTNATATNPPARLNPLDLLRGLQKQEPAPEKK